MNPLLLCIEKMFSNPFGQRYLHVCLSELHFSCAITEDNILHSDMLEHGRKEVVHRRVFRKLEKASCWEIATTFTSQDERQVMMVVAVPIGDASAVHHK